MQNAIIVSFTNLTNFQNFVNAEKLKRGGELWEENLIEKTITIPIYLLKNVEESDYVESFELVEREEPKRDYPEEDYSDIEICKCPE